MPVSFQAQTSFTPALLSQWQTLFRQLNCTAFFMHPAYQEAWWQNEGKGELHLLTLENEAGELAGILPLYKDADGLVRIVGAVDLSDYLDVLVLPEYQSRFYVEILSYFSSQGWKSIKLESIHHASPTLTEFSQQAKKTGWVVSQTEQDVCPVVTLPTSWEEYLQQLEPKTSKNFTRLLNEIGEEDEITYRLVTDPEKMAEATATFIQLHKKSSEEKKQFWTSGREKLFVTTAVELAKENLVKLYFLDVNGDPAATLFIFDYQDQFLLYNSGFDAYQYGYLGVGNAIILHTLKEAIALGKKRYDFMRGSEPYKFLFGAKSEPLFDLHLTQA